MTPLRILALDLNHARSYAFKQGWRRTSDVRDVQDDLDLLGYLGELIVLDCARGRRDYPSLIELALALQDEGGLRIRWEPCA